MPPRWVLNRAHRARRGQHDSLEVRSKRAATRAESAAALSCQSFGGSPYERQLAMLLDLFEMPYVPQMAVGAYNLDFAVEYLPHTHIAVEVRGGAKDRQRRAGRLEDLRVRYIPVLEIFVGKWCHQPAVTIGAITYLREFQKNLRDDFLMLAMDGDAFAEHRMILGDGTVLQPGHSWDYALTSGAT